MNWSSDENIQRIYRLLRIKGYGPVQVNKLLYKYQAQIHSSVDFERCIVHALTPKECEEYLRDIELYHSKNFQVSYRSILDEEKYPEELRLYLSQRAPSVLSYIGNIDLLKKKKVAFSGSRKVSDTGLWITRDCISQLSTDKDICVVSGYAGGVDMTAHYTALENGISTIIILPVGISYFSIRKELQRVWDIDRVLVISEFLPYDQWMEGRAMQRNKTIIGLCSAVVVVEAGDTGGSMDAGKQTLESGKKLFVPKFAIPPISASGNSKLLQRGALPLAMNPITHQTNLKELWKSLQTKPKQSLFD